MRIERIKINNGDRVFEESFSPSDNLICVLDNEKIFRSDYKNVFKKKSISYFIKYINWGIIYENSNNFRHTTRNY